ncbi:MAG: PKD domain-containing protein [Ferruginibacter sp.]
MKLLYISLIGLFAIGAISSCKKEDSIAAPTTDFTFKAANLAVSFTNESTNGRYFSWDFGDKSTASTNMSPGHSYMDEGTYTVALTVTGRDGSTKTVSKPITVTAPPNLVQGGKFDVGDENKWTLLNISPGVAVSYTGGKAVWKGGGWGHAGIYQAIQVEANKKYQVNITVSGSGASDTWFEVYVGKAAPVQGQDYSDGGTRLALNTWNGCGKTAFSGPLTSLSCGGQGGGVVEFTTAGTVYLVIRGGGDNLGTTGISVDNVELRLLK